MEKSENTAKVSKAKQRINWSEVGVQVGVAAIQGAAFALGGIVVGRLSGARISTPAVDSTADNVIPMASKKLA